jgi:hypothetical protein
VNAVKSGDRNRQKQAFKKVINGVLLGFELARAVEARDHAKVESLLEQGADPDHEVCIPGKDGVPVICIADPQSAQLLKKAGGQT